MRLQPIIKYVRGMHMQCIALQQDSVWASMTKVRYLWMLSGMSVM